MFRVPWHPSVDTLAVVGLPTISAIGAFGTMITVWQICWGGKDLQLVAKSTMRSASMRPYPNLCEYCRPAPFLNHPGSSSKGSAFDDITTRYCISLHVRLGFASELI